MTFISEKIRVSCENLQNLIVVEKKEINDVLMIPCGYKESNDAPSDDASWKEYGNEELNAPIDSHFWFKFDVEVPSASDNYEFRLAAITGREGQWDADNPQCTLFVDGETYQAFDTNHTRTPLKSGKHKVFVYFYTGMKEGSVSIKFSLEKADKRIEKIYYDLYVPYCAMINLDTESRAYNDICNTLDQATFLIDFRHKYSKEFYESISMCEQFMEKEFYDKLCGKEEYILSVIGHTHIDVAWLWTIAQTREKAQRSFSTVIRLMEQYPEYIFMSSQPQLYQYVKESDPQLYKKIKERIKEGRWEPEGAMWLEADTNIVSGESLIRQILLGKRFMNEEFGKDNSILWLPDVFGYSAALPQILKKSGITQFFTTKISWNETNSFPHDNFIWQGIDGSEIFAVLSDDYARKLNADMIMTAWSKHTDKKYTKRHISTFGFGDGGGGPTAEMLENYRRMKKGLPGFAKIEMRKSKDIIDDIENEFLKSADDLRFVPKWSGELYLEMHRGTYTSMAKNKKNNRKSEILYQNAETASVIESVFNKNSEYPYETLDVNWHTILKNQFHDIIPGSSIKEVYDTCDAEYSKVIADGEKVLSEKIEYIAANVDAQAGDVLLYNPSPFVSDVVVGNEYYGNIPAHGWKVVKPGESEECSVFAGERIIENDVLKVTFDEKYHIVSVYDKTVEREIIPEGERANVLEVYEDYPRCYDAWEITEYYKQKKWIADDVSSVDIINDKARAGLKIVRKYGNSEIVQKITLRKGSKRLDFETAVDWQEDHVLLKAAFPVDIRNSNAKYEIQFGHIERPTHRNTPWDQAKFEVCAHKWADLSEADYGVSLLNDCKYGYSTEENVMKITLLKAATYPNPVADRGMHKFTYSLLAHKNALGEDTIREAYLLNNPVIVKEVTNTGEIPSEYSIVSVSDDDFVIETVKRAEKDDGIIIRGYESQGRKCTTKIRVGFDVKKAYVCDLMENVISPIPTDNNFIEIKAGNFEIVTIKLEK